MNFPEMAAGDSVKIATSEQTQKLCISRSFRKPPLRNVHVKFWYLNSYVTGKKIGNLLEQVVRGEERR